MKREDFWKTLLSPEEPSLVHEIAQTHYDAILEIDLIAGTFQYVFLLENKYAGAAATHKSDDLISFVADHLVHPEDADDYRAMLESATMRDRMKAETGILCHDFRVKGIEGNWIRTRQMLIGGSELGLSDDVVRCYVYDLDWDQKSRATSAREDVTGLLDGNAYFRIIQDGLEDIPEGWCLMYIKIDHHKLFTDWYGLEAGQHLLVHVADILKKEASDTNGTPGYLGEEDFVLTCPYDEERIESLRISIKKEVSSLCKLEGFEPIIGIAMIDGSCHDVREYFNHAALTAEEIKTDISALVKVYDLEQHKQKSFEYRILYDFRNAIELGEITFWLQPQCDLSNRKIVGAEALARWIKADGTMIPPGMFVPVLERHRQIPLLDAYIWESVCKWIRAWKGQGRASVPISVNISQIDVFMMDVPTYFGNLIQKYDLDVRDIKVEITESAYVEDSDTVKSVVQRLREMGFKVMMDDFGSGYSSLNMLSSMNMDVIKLDSQFIQGENEDVKSVSIIESIVNLTRNLSTPIVVEGVETQGQAHFLSDLGCRYAQGFFFYRPMPTDQFETLISQSGKVDESGIVPKNNQQIHLRELHDANIFSDAMLNNLIGPIAMYCWHGDDIDIYRYNEQFFRIVGIDIKDFNDRVRSIQNYILKNDRELMYNLLRTAEEHPVLGAKGVVRTFRPNGVLVSLSLQIYFINEDDEGKKFYASARDVSELQLINTDLPGGYFRCLLEEDDFEFIFVSQNFLEMTGYSESELHSEFDYKYGRMIHPSDITRVRKESKARNLDIKQDMHPYRIRRKRGDYIYVDDQSRITDQFGAPCWQNVVVDVTKLMHNHSQMRVLSSFSDETVLFMSREVDGLTYEVVIHGLENEVELSTGQLEQALNSGAFYTWIEGYSGSAQHQERTLAFITSALDRPREMSVNLPNGKHVRLTIEAKRVCDDSNIEYIVKLQLAS